MVYADKIKPKHQKRMDIQLERINPNVIVPKVTPPDNDSKTTLDEVIEHYSSGIHVSPTIDPLIEFSSQGGVQLDAQEKYLLKKFLLTLSDDSFINNPNFMNPH